MEFRNGQVLTVLGYNEDQNYHKCLSEKGQRMRVDLMVDGSFGDIDPRSLINKKVHVEYTHAYIQIAASPQVVGVAEKEPSNE